jgi:hypothetical protein
VIHLERELEDLPLLLVEVGTLLCPLELVSLIGFPDVHGEI